MIYTASLPEIPKIQQLKGYPGEIHAISVTHMYFVRGSGSPIDISEKVLFYLANDKKVIKAKTMLEAECGFSLHMNNSKRSDEKGAVIVYVTDIAKIVPGGLDVLVEWNDIPAILAAESNQN